jgi:hypothetical protein
VTDKIKDKISKLLNMTVENGCSEDEQETAMRMAAGMAAAAGIDLDSVHPAEAPKRKATYKYVRQEYKPHQAYCAQAAAELYGVECTIYNLGADGVNFVGREENIDLAEQTWFWLMRQVEWLYKQELPRGLTQTARAEFRKTFKAACAMRVKERAIKLMREIVLNDTNAQAATGHNALVVQGHFKTLYAEIEEYWNERMKPHEEAAKKREAELEKLKRENPAAYKAYKKMLDKMSRPRMRRGRSMPVGSGTNVGYAAGDRVTLRKEVQ